MSKAVLVIAKFPKSCAECAILYGKSGFCSCGGLVAGMNWNPLKDRAPFCPLMELPGEISPEDCEIYKVGQEDDMKENDKDMIAYGAAVGWNSLLDVLTEGRGSNES